MATVFVSPGVYTREQDFSVYASRIGLTRLGLVGLTLKGPAFEPIKVKSTDEFLFRFGTTYSSYETPYVANSFLTQSNELTVTRILGQEGFTNSPAWLIKATGGAKAGAVVAVIRSKSADDGATFILNNPTDVRMGLTTGVLSPFTISATTGSLTAYTDGITVSLDESRDDYIVNVFGKSALEGNYDIYVESIFPHFIREANSRGDITGILSGTVFTNETAWTDYGDVYACAITPYVVSRVVGNSVSDLFRFQTISDGDSANKEIKISIANIDTVNKTFDVIIRSFDDTDATASQTSYESFRTLSMKRSDANFIGKAIGTTDEEYPRQSIFVTIDLATNFQQDTVPGGFRGYNIRNTAVSSTTNADIYYKTEYFSGDSINKTYLGVSELGYTGFTTDQVSYSKAIKTIESDLFSYQGGAATGLTTVKGFHLESTAPSASFITGKNSTLTAYTKSERKFTFVPAGGFDGWNKFKLPTFTSSVNDVNNVVAIKAAIATMANPEEVDINLLATPDVNYDNNEDVVKYALSMIEDRADSLYIINSPRLTVGTTKGTSDEAVSTLQDTGIDSSYAATYWPWVQINDVNTNQYVYVSPTAEVVRCIALTDNVSYPWFAPAGYNRGTAGGLVVRADVKLDKDDRDTLYDDRINPVATFVQQGVVIFGQKTLQIRQSALDRINVRRLLLQVRRLVAAASQTLLFEQNDQTLRDQFLSRVEPILLQIQNQRGLTAFKVVMDDTNNTSETIDRNQLNGKIQLKPTPSMEFLSLTFSVLPSGASFEDF